MVAGNPNDNDYYAWMMRYSAAAISHGRLPALVTMALDAPQGINLMWNNSILAPGILLTPVTDLFGPQASLTVLVTLGFAGSAASMLFVLRRWGISLFAATLGGAVYGFSPALLHSAIGHYNLQFAVLPPLIIDAGLRLCHTGASAAAAARYQGGPPEYLAYLGVPLIVALAVALVALWRDLRIRALGLTFGVLVLLSLGAHPLLSGTTHYGITLPWGWLCHLPVLSSVLPAPISVVADGAAAALLCL